LDQISKMPDQFLNLHYTFDNTESDLYDSEYKSVIRQIQEKYKIHIANSEVNITKIDFNRGRCNVWIDKLKVADEFTFSIDR